MTFLDLRIGAANICKTLYFLAYEYQKLEIWTGLTELIFYSTYWWTMDGTGAPWLEDDSRGGGGAWGWGGELIGFKAMCIPLVIKVLLFLIHVSPLDVPWYFWTCRVHTAWEFLHKNGGSDHTSRWLSICAKLNPYCKDWWLWHRQLHLQGRKHPGKYWTGNILLQGYCDRGIHNQSDESLLWYVICSDTEIHLLGLHRERPLEECLSWLMEWWNDGLMV